MKIKVLILFALISMSAWGGQERGGGNSVGGVMVENYITDIRDLECYKTHLQPILKKLKADMPYYEQLLSHKLDTFTWYVMPTEVDKVPETDNFLPIVSDQVASQNIYTHEVFINSKIFESMPLKQQATLILHELNLAISYHFYRYRPEKHTTVRKLTGLVMAAAPSTKIQRSLYDLVSDFNGTPVYVVLTRDEINRIKGFLNPLLDNFTQICKENGPEDVIRIQKLYDAVYEQMSQADATQYMLFHMQKIYSEWTMFSREYCKVESYRLDI